MSQDCGMIRKEEYWNMLRCFSKLKGYEGWLLAQMNWHANRSFPVKKQNSSQT